MCTKCCSQSRNYIKKYCWRYYPCWQKHFVVSCDDDTMTHNDSAFCWIIMRWWHNDTQWQRFLLDYHAIMTQWHTIEAVHHQSCTLIDAWSLTTTVAPSALSQDSVRAHLSSAASALHSTQHSTLLVWLDHVTCADTIIPHSIQHYLFNKTTYHVQTLSFLTAFDIISLNGPRNMCRHCLIITNST